MSASVATPAVRQKRSKLAATCCQASSTIPAGTTLAGVIDFSMALLSFADSAPRAYWLKAGNAYLTFSTSTGTFPSPFRAMHLAIEHLLTSFARHAPDAARLVVKLHPLDSGNIDWRAVTGH